MDLEQRVWSRNEIYKKTACLDRTTFFKEKKTPFDVWNRFGTELAFPNIWVCGYLERKMNYGSEVEGTRLCKGT
jgi:hypothetical protein